MPLRLGKTAWLVLEPHDVLHVLENSESTYSKGRAFRFGRRLYGNSLLVSEGQETLTLKEHSYAVFSVSFSPDGRRIVSGSGDFTAKVWDAQTGKETVTGNPHGSSS